MNPPNPGNSFWSRRRWLARLSFSFLIIAIFLGYTAFRGAQSRELREGRVVLYLVAALLGFVLFLLGTREKHRPPDDDMDEPP